jgi:outer membrane receptor protein involved in Fe transport
VFIDGVYRSRTGAGLNELGEIERIEVLRGPQGTLFGRNASAGLLNIISKKPNLNRMEGYGEATYGNYDFIRVGAGVTGPIGETGLGYRLDGVYVERDGFYRVINAANGTESRVNDRDRYFIRGQLSYEPSDTLEFRLIGDYTRRNESCCGATYISAGRDVRSDAERDARTRIPSGTLPDATTASSISSAAWAAFCRASAIPITVGSRSPGPQLSRRDRGQGHFRPDRLDARLRQPDLHHRLSRL